MSFWTALAEIESGGNDYVVGDVGEISRYQIRPEVWRAYSSSRRYADPTVALPIAEKHLAKLKRDFVRLSGRAATEADCVILWKSGIAGYEKRGFNPARMSAAHQDRIVRFHNLRMEGLTLARVSAREPASAISTPGGEKMTVATAVEPSFFAPPDISQDALASFGTLTLTNLPGQAGLFNQAESLPGTAQYFTLYLQ